METSISVASKLSSDLLQYEYFSIPDHEMINEISYGYEGVASARSLRATQHVIRI